MPVKPIAAPQTHVDPVAAATSREFSFIELQHYLNQHGFWFRGRHDGDALFGRNFDDLQLLVPICGHSVTTTTMAWLNTFFQEEGSSVTPRKARQKQGDS